MIFLLSLSNLRKYSDTEKICNFLNFVLNFIFNFFWCVEKTNVAFNWVGF